MARFLNSQRSFSSLFQIHLLLGGVYTGLLPTRRGRFPSKAGTSETPGEYFYSETWSYKLLMAEIGLYNQLRERWFLSLFTTGFKNIQTVVGLGISEPSINSIKDALLRWICFSYMFVSTYSRTDFGDDPCNPFIFSHL